MSHPFTLTDIQTNQLFKRFINDSAFTDVFESNTNVDGEEILRTTLDTLAG